MSALLKMEQQVYWQECVECGISFGLLQSWDQQLRKNRKAFYCPGGHSQRYTGDNEEQKLKKQLDAEVARRERAEKDAEWERHVAKNARTQAIKARNKLKRVETRIHAGVCPHCNRTFKQLAAHMKCKHKDQIADPVEAADA